MPVFRRSRRASLWTALLVLTGCDGGVLVTLGMKPPAALRFGTPRLLTELASDGDDTNPVLTNDLLEIYFTRARSVDSDIWRAVRSSVVEPFGAPEPVTAVNTLQQEASAAVSADGLTLWHGSARGTFGADLDIWVSRRAARSDVWSTPVREPALNSSGSDVPRAPGMYGTVMPLGSDRGQPSVHRTYFAVRATPDSEFATPLPVAGLTFDDRSVMDAFLTDDGLTLLYASGPAEPGAGVGATAGPADLFVAIRQTVDQAFTPLGPLQDLNTAQNERDPWLSPDGLRLYFASDRQGRMAVYEALAIR